MNINPIYNIAEICAQKNLRTIILSPGSRVAPLTLSFVKHQKTQTFTISDERAAAFTAIGMANQLLNKKNSNTPIDLVGIACTSGTASYNYAPAIAEAFYQEIPLLIFTADRPPEWTNQQDGQTIQQFEIYGKHVKKSYQLPVDYSHQEAIWQGERLINEAINLAQTHPFGPVHINIPIREPFYPKKDEKIIFNSKFKKITLTSSIKVLEKSIWNELLNIWESTDKKLIVVGQGFWSDNMKKVLNNLIEDFKVPLAIDKISNLHGLQNIIQFQDTFLLEKQEDFLTQLRPELLITFGKSLISKSLKLYLRQNKAIRHWHIQEAGQVADTFQSLTRIIPVSPEYFFSQLFSDLDFKNMLDGEVEDSHFYQNWQKANFKARKYINTFFEQNREDKLSEFEVVKIVLEKIPNQSILHLANSMPVRYVNFLPFHKKVEIFSNRGTSGIDGCTSTAVGSAMCAQDKIITLITGDVAFFYDSNAFWQNYLPNNLRIILLNNKGGNIFRMIKGAKNQDELEIYFETEQRRNAILLAQDFGLEYFEIKERQKLYEALKDFFLPSENSKILEIHTDKVYNTEFFERFKNSFKI